MTPADETRLAMVEQWLRKADEDLAVAEYLVSSERPYYGAVGFHAQQAAEKYLKALLVRHQIEFPKTHDFEKLLTLCARVSREFEKLQPQTDRLQPFAVAARYTLVVPQESEVEQAVQDMKRVRAFCRGVLGLTER